MLIREITTESVGRIVKGVNTTADVGVDQTRIEASKFGNKVDKDGRPPELHSKARKNSDPNTLYNLGLAEAKGKKDTIKPRDPNWREMQELRRSGAMGAHKDKKRDSKNPRKAKHKGKDMSESWSKTYKDSIDCSNPKGFSQKAYCAGKKK